MNLLLWLSLALSPYFAPSAGQTLGPSTYARAPFLEPLKGCTMVKVCDPVTIFDEGVMMCDVTSADIWLYYFFVDIRTFFGDSDCFKRAGVEFR